MNLGHRTLKTSPVDPVPNVSVEAEDISVTEADANKSTRLGQLELSIQGRRVSSSTTSGISTPPTAILVTSSFHPSSIFGQGPIGVMALGLMSP
jgi:hypothetical protein